MRLRSSTAHYNNAVVLSLAADSGGRRGNMRGGGGGIYNSRVFVTLTRTSRPLWRRGETMLLLP